MRRIPAVGPSFGAVRPIEPTDPLFPVYDGLPALLLDPKPSLAPGEVVPHLLSVASAYSYSTDPDTLLTIMTRMGLEGCHGQAISETVDAMLIDANAHLIQSKDGRVVIVAFRGTPPMSAVTWLVDADTSPRDVVLRSLPAGEAGDKYQVHAGFYRNTRAVRYAILEGLQRALTGKSVTGTGSLESPMQALYVTGHSLGAAMAAMFTVMLRADSRYRDIVACLRGTCTYGQPMIMNAALAEYVQEQGLDGIMARYVYRKDPVPACPPTFTGSYTHVGPEYRYGKDEWRQAPHPTGQTHLADLLMLSVAPLRERTLLRNLPFRGLSIDDHSPVNYVTALTPAGKPNEYGDDVFA